MFYHKGRLPKAESEPAHVREIANFGILYNLTRKRELACSEDREGR